MGTVQYGKDGEEDSMVMFPYRLIEDLVANVTYPQDADRTDDNHVEQHDIVLTGDQLTHCCNRFAKDLTFMNVRCIMGGKKKWPDRREETLSIGDRKLETLLFDSPTSMATLDGNIRAACALAQM